MATFTRGRNPSQSGGTPPRTTRIADDVWDAAKARAKEEGFTIGGLLALFAQGYAEGKIDAPRVSVEFPGRK